jgi:hypothetical protein
MNKTLFWEITKLLIDNMKKETTITEEEKALKSFIVLICAMLHFVCVYVLTNVTFRMIDNLAY